jgi:hypothetical protein
MRKIFPVYAACLLSVFLARPASAGIVGVCTATACLNDNGGETIEDMSVGNTDTFKFTIPSGTEYFDISALPASDANDYFSVSTYLTGILQSSFNIGSSGGNFGLTTGSWTVDVTLSQLVVAVSSDPPIGFELSDQPLDLQAVTPLPSTWTMMLTGLIGLGFVAYRRQKPGRNLAAA